MENYNRKFKKYDGMESNMNSSLYTYLCEDIYAHINLIKDLEDKKLHKNISLKNLKTIKKSDKIESFMDVSINILSFLQIKQISILYLR